MLAMPLEAFAGLDADGEPTGEGAAAFGRCVQRMTVLIDPSWTMELYDWMTENIPVAMLLDEVTTEPRRGLRARFWRIPDKKDPGSSLVCFSIGVATDIRGGGTPDR